jgi:hypothetical protein
METLCNGSSLPRNGNSLPFMETIFEKQGMFENKNSVFDAQFAQKYPKNNLLVRLHISLIYTFVNILFVNIIVSCTCSFKKISSFFQ